MKRILKKPLLILAALLSASTAHATLPYTNGDLFLGFRASSGTGANQDYLVNIGPASTYANAASPIVVGSVATTGADLTATFGANWKSRPEVFWSISGANLSGDTSNTLYVTRAESTPGTNANPWLGRSPSSQGVTNTKFNALAGAYINGTASTNNPAGTIQNVSDANSYASFQPGGTAPNSGGISFGAFNPTIEGSFINGTAGSVLDLFKVEPVFDQPSQRLGYFQIDDSGVVTFIPATFSTIRIANAPYTVSEEDGNVAVKVLRGGDTTEVATVDLATTDGTALAGTHYTTVNTEVSFGIGVKEVTVNVPVQAIAGYQGSRSFGLTLSDPSAGSVLVPLSSSTVTITDSTPAPVSFTSASYFFSPLDGDSNPSLIQFTVERGDSESGEVSVDVSVTGGTLGVADYTFTSPTTVTFAEGETSKQVEIQLNSIAAEDLPGTIILGLSNPVDTTVGSIASTTATIATPSTLSFSSATFQGGESGSGDTEIEITVNREGGSSGEVSVEVDATAGTATEGEDYTLPATPITLTWDDGETGEQTFVITVHSDAVLESTPETILLALQNITGNAASGSQDTATVTIADPDSSIPTLTVTSPIQAKKYTAGTVTFSGTAQDNQGISRVEISLNGGAPESVEPVSPSSNFNWSTNLIPEQGANTAVIIAYDLIGNPSASVTRNFTFVNFRPEFTGSYNGLLVAAVGSTTPINHHGLVNVKVTSTGSFSGKVTLAGVALPIKGTFGTDGEAVFSNGLETFELIKKGNPAVSLGHLGLTLDVADGDVVTGVLKNGTGGGATVLADILHADRALYTAKKNPTAPLVNVPVTLLDPTKEKGKYTAVFQADSTVDVGLAADQYPQGDGYATVTISSSGVAKIVGKLADGSPITYSNALSQNNEWPVYIQLYGKKGFIAANVAFDHTETDSDALALNAKWFKPAALPNQKFYPNGWPAGITADFAASKYIAPKKVTAALPNPPNPDTALGAGVSGAANTTTPNIFVTLTDGGLATNTSNDASLDAASKVTVLGASTGETAATGLKVTFNAATGSLGGSFTHPVTGKLLKFAGVAFQKTHTATGHFLFVPPATAVGDLAESGAVGVAEIVP